MAVLNKLSYWVFLVIYFVLVGCATRTIESTLITTRNQDCPIEAYEDLVIQSAAALSPGVRRSVVIHTLSQMAIKVWNGDLLPSGDECRTKHLINSQPGTPVYDIVFQSEVTFFTSSTTVCLNHTDLDGPDRYGIRVDDSEIKYPWKWVDQGPSVDGLPDGYFARRAYVPVCFNRNGEIEGYLNG